MHATQSNHTARNHDVVDVQMPSTMSEYLRVMGEYLVTRNDDGEFVLRHDRAFWLTFFEGAFDAEGPSPDVAFDHLEAVLSDWNATMGMEGAPTPIPL